MCSMDFGTMGRLDYSWKGGRIAGLGIEIIVLRVGSGLSSCLMRTGICLWRWRWESGRHGELVWLESCCFRRAEHIR